MSLNGEPQKIFNNFDYQIAGKTGTTNENQDAWFIGFSSEITIGVFVGFDVPKSLGRLETGSKVAAPIFEDFYIVFIIKINQNLLIYLTL